MNRNIVYPGSIPQDVDILNLNRNVLISLGYLAQGVLGTGTVVDGLACTQTTVASLVVNVAQGSIFALETIDSSSYGSLPSDANPLVKIGISPEGVTPFTLTAPGTAGQSINYLIEASFLESDTNPVVLPYYNASNPSQPYSGPANSGTPQNLLRQEVVSLQLKAGVAATTGTQTTPAVDAGWVGLYVITVNNGQTQVFNAGILTYPGAPFINPKLTQLRKILTANLSLYVSATGNDNNDGLFSTTPFATRQKAWNTVIGNYDLNGFTVTVNCTGALADSLQAYGAALGQSAGAQQIVFDGDSSATIATSNADTWFAANGAGYTVQNFSTMSASGTGANQGVIFAAVANGQILHKTNVLGAAAVAHIKPISGGIVTAVAAYSITGASPYHLDASDLGYISANGGYTVTLTGSLAFTDFAFASSGVIDLPGFTFTGGTITGVRYNAVLNGVINTQGGGANYFPGNSSGTTATGGQYV